MRHTPKTIRKMLATRRKNMESRAAERRERVVAAYTKGIVAPKIEGRRGKIITVDTKDVAAPEDTRPVDALNLAFPGDRLVALLLRRVALLEERVALLERPPERP